VEKFSPQIFSGEERAWTSTTITAKITATIPAKISATIPAKIPAPIAYPHPRSYSRREPLEKDSRRTHGIRVSVAPQRTLNAAPGGRALPESHYDIHDLLEF